MTATVAITGVSGFIGRHIAANLLERGFDVRALTRHVCESSLNNLTWVYGALEQRDALDELVRGADSVIHCAGQVRGHKEESFINCNVNGSIRLMQAAKESERCKRFLYISSLAARHPELSWYAHSKYLAEQQLTALATDIKLGIFRPTAVYGPGDRELKPLFSWLLRGLLPRLGEADARLSFLHVSDLAAAASQWILSDQHPFGPFELCDGIAGGYSWRRLQEIGADIRHGSVRLIDIPLPLLKLFADISWLSNRVVGSEPMLTRNKIRELTHKDWSASNTCLSGQINWFPQISLEHALREGAF
ncbi:NAD-dependent epimerase/dehydratase family protein [Erwinia sorbitola]|uniref:NAD-dependent epimerase/dehydratase family protein n=1 Tax=Erwinia sorbitola TaxID=2681984 RepID=A0A6I6EKY1_9GAMM|nr:NAD-dependent epimerase/dehydratase family protein [Erwinia sorbitola]MTD26185.1 NAD-dependent epimerase/dehydratase family protein [Erwinia sorbitola]QGU87281.1 NAD-dependent epimerase/dehydratase family protein [Erwinia sorbitola]